MDIGKGGGESTAASMKGPESQTFVIRIYDQSSHMRRFMEARRDRARGLGWGGWTSKEAGAVTQVGGHPSQKIQRH